MKEYWNEAISYEKYIQDATERMNAPLTDEDREMHEYYKLGLQRMERMQKKYQPDAEQLQTLADKNFDGKVMIISEAWCGDASQCVPVVNAFFSGNNEVRISYRDGENSAIDHFLTNGGKSIPIVVLLDDDFNVIAHWGPRPAHGTELLQKYKADSEAYPKEQFYNDLQLYYAKNRGYDTIAEILKLI
ncbi:MAG: thioredoxin family protein [Chryseobacterium sp.]|nr:MAG: thioredoxin family protein [Chryseobacterium sp.]